MERTSTACTSTRQVIAAASVVTHAPDAASLGLTLVAPGLRIDEATDVTWRTCRVRLQPRVYGGWAITGGGVPVTPAGQRLITRDDPIPAPEAEPEHPTVAGARFAGSTSLSIGAQRAGLWTMANGRSSIARYTVGVEAAPVPMLASTLPILGIFYLGAPDAPGGTLQLWQRVSEVRYRHLGISWNEEGAR